MRIFRKVAGDKRGNVLAITAAALPLLVGTMGLGVDFAQWVMWKRTLQGAADAAAMAGATARKGGLNDTQVTAEVVKVLDANAKVTRSSTQVTFELSPGQATGATPTTVSVVAEAQGRLYFARLFTNGQPTIRASAKAGPRGPGNDCFMALDTTAAKALWIKGSPTVTAGCGFVANSNHTNALYLEGNAVLNAATATAVGGVNKEGSSSWGTTVRVPNAPAVADPYGASGRNLQAPACSVWKDVTQGSNASTNFWHKDNDTPHTSPAGCYNVPSGGVVQLDGNGKIQLASGGVYVFRTNGSGEGIIKIDGNLDLVGAGVSIVLMNGARLEINGTVNVNLSAMTTAEADTYHPTDANRRALAGILIWQKDASNPTDKNSFITGNANTQLKGAIYTPNQGFELKGNMASSQCLQLVAKTILIEGNAGVTNNCPPGDANYQNFGAGQIHLTA